MPKQAAIKSLEECELLNSLVECNFVVGYYDTFIEESKINIVMEYCQHGDLHHFIRKQR